MAKAEKGQKEDFPNGIPECGTDALRFALVAYTTQARDINLDIQRVHGYRTWCNKLYNAIRFAMMNLPKDFLPSPQLVRHPRPPPRPRRRALYAWSRRGSLRQMSSPESPSIRPTHPPHRVHYADRHHRGGAAQGAAEVAALPMCGQWIVSRLNKAVAATNEAMDKYDFATSTTAVYAYWQYDLCDVFIELMKVRPLPRR